MTDVRDKVEMKVELMHCAVAKELSEYMTDMKKKLPASTDDLPLITTFFVEQIAQLRVAIGYVVNPTELQ